ncbi:MFS transporter permease [Microbacterium flavum]|nr:MFS transporter permease [Microbacterium flavum]
MALHEMFWLRRGFYRWLIPAAFVLPLWLFVGWIVFGANPLSLLWVLLSAPIVFVGQLVLTLLVRARGTARAERAVSWPDLGLIGGWNVLVIALGVFSNPWWWALFFLTIVVGIGALWSTLSQLWREARPSRLVMHTAEGIGYVPAPSQESAPRADAEVIVIREKGAGPVG